MMQQDTMPAERLESRDRAPVAQEVTNLSPGQDATSPGVNKTLFQ